MHTRVIFKEKNKSKKDIKLVIPEHRFQFHSSELTTFIFFQERKTQTFKFS